MLYGPLNPILVHIKPIRRIGTLKKPIDNLRFILMLFQISHFD